MTSTIFIGDLYMKIDRKKLVSELARALPGISVGTVKIEGADTFVFKGGHIYTYNSVISVDVKVDGIEELSGIVSAKEFYDCLTKLPSDEVEIEVTDKSWVLHDDKIKVTVNLLEVKNIFERFNSITPNEDAWLKIDTEEFKHALNICSIPRNSTKFSGLNFTGNEVWSTDQSEINRYELKTEYPKFMISEAAVAELSKLSNLTHMQYNKRWVQFLSEDGIVFSVRSISQEAFPIDLISKLVTKVKDEPVFVEMALTDKFFSAMSRALSFSSEMEGVKTVSVSFGKEVKVVSSRKSGSYEEVVEDMSLDCDDFKLNLNADLFLSTDNRFETLKVLGEGELDEDTQVHLLFINGDFDTGSLKLCSNVTE